MKVNARLLNSSQSRPRFVYIGPFDSFRRRRWPSERASERGGRDASNIERESMTKRPFTATAALMQLACPTLPITPSFVPLDADLVVGVAGCQITYLEATRDSEEGATLHPNLGAR